MRRIAAAAALALALLAGCTPDPGPTSNPATTLRILAGSELSDLQPVLDQAGADIGMKVELTPVGSLEGAEQVAFDDTTGQTQDAIWFSSNRYLALLPESRGRLGTSTEIMSSPVVLGLRHSVAEQLGWVGRPVTWAEIAAAAGAGRFSYGMTDPSASNSGFSAVVAVATALAGSGSALTLEQADSTVPGLREFFGAQQLAAGSSGFLRDAYVARATGTAPGAPVDGLVNYESVLLEMNASGQLPEPLELIRPADGVVTADYPLTVLNAASPEKQDAYRRLVDHLRTPDVQRTIAETTHRRPAVPGVVPVPADTPVELPFPSDAEVVDRLLSSYFDKLRRPSRTIYVLDTSGSMEGDERIGELRRSLIALAGGDTSLTGRFRRFRGREEVTLLPFNTVPEPAQTYTVAEDDRGPDRQRIADAAAALQPGGDTAIYDSLRAAYQLAERQIAEDPDRITSIVLMTDGENTTGIDRVDFLTFVQNRPTALRDVPVYTILFGESDAAAMNEVARLTGGRTFDAHQSSLAEVFREIRGYV